MESISIPLDIIEQLNRQLSSSESTSCDINSSATAGRNSCCFEPILLYYKYPPPSGHTSSRTSRHEEERKQQQLFVILDNVIPLSTPSSPNDNSNKVDDENNDSSTVRLHPLLEEFMVLSANAIDANKSAIAESNEDEASPSSITMSPITVWIQYIHPPEFYSDSFLTNDDANSTPIQPDKSDNEDYSNDQSGNKVYYNDDDLLYCKVSNQKFHLQRLPYYIHDLTTCATAVDDSNDGCCADLKYKVDMTLEFIYCSDERYEQLFIQMAKSKWRHQHGIDNVTDMPKEEVEMRKMSQHQQQLMYEYLHELLCQELEYKVVKECMIVPIVLPPLLQSAEDSYDDDNFYRNSGSSDEDAIVAFFKLRTLDVQIGTKLDDNEYRNGFEYCAFKNNDHGCYRIGAIPHDEDFLNEVNDENEYRDNNYVSIQIMLSPRIENDGVAFELNEGDLKLPLKLDDCIKDYSCPGYEELVEEIVSLANIRVVSGSPTAVLLTGCTGVGKSTLASVVIRKLENRVNTINSISAKDLLLQASSSLIDVGSLKRMIFQPTSTTNRQRFVLVIDDLNVLLEDGGEANSASSILFHERRAALNAVLESIEELVKERIQRNTFNVDKSYNQIPFIFGICRGEPLEIPSFLTQVGRFEKVLTMPPPSEIQRREILKSAIGQLPNTSTGIENLLDTWSAALARTTAGCVASDLRSICTDALAISKARHSKEEPICESSLFRIIEGDGCVTWDDLREAVRSCIPSQLADLDVSIPRDDMDYLGTSFLSSNDGDKRGTKEWFDHCWKHFGGYDDIKADLYRSVFRPWCRHHHHGSVGNGPMMSELERKVPPPTGILLHGLSGNGKTFAADCLARSLGLNIVKVRAHDILDKWLGGSEAALRAIFSRSRAAAPCLLLFDELDALATNREDCEESDGGSSDLYSRLLSTLLNEMDGVSNVIGGSKNNIVVVGTTNRIHAIDAALLRPGRFEKHVLLENPSALDIHEILKIYLDKAPLHPDVDLMEISELLDELGASGADVRGLCTESCLIAIRHTEDTTGLDNVDNMFVRMRDFDEAIRLWKR